MALDDVLDPAIDAGEAHREAAGLRVIERPPIAVGESRRPLEAATPGETIGQGLMLGASTLTTKAPRSRRRTSVAAPRLMQTTSEGGFSESEVSAVTVQPERASPSPQVTMATPEANSRMAIRNAAPSASAGATLIPLASSWSCRLSRQSIP